MRDAGQVGAHQSQSAAISVNPDAREVTIADRATDTEATLGYDIMQMVPPRSAPDWVKEDLTAGKAPTASTRGLRVLSADHLAARDAARRVRLFHEADASDSGDRNDEGVARRGYLKRDGLPALYLQGMLGGIA